MIRVINCDNVNCCYGNKILLRDLNFSIEKGSFVSVIGNNGSGKSTLVKILGGLIPYNGYINVNGYSLDKSNIYNIRKSVKIILGDMDNYFVGNTVLDELVVSLENMGESRSDIKRKLDNIVKEFELDNILERNIYDLTNSERQIVSVASALIQDIDILIMDDCLNQLNVKDKSRILDIISDYKKKKKLTVIMVTHDMESVLYSDRIMVLNDGKLVMDGSAVSILKQRDKLLELGIGSTFVVDLSVKLLEKGVVNHVYLDMRKLVDRLWK